MDFFYSRSGSLLANNVDITRLAREIRKRKPGMTMPEALDLVCELFGLRNYHQARRQAETPDVSSWSDKDIRSELQRRGISDGKTFPKNLPRKFGIDWQQAARALFANALKARVAGKLEFIAVVGAAETGKTLLAMHEVAERGGAVLDTGFAYGLNNSPTGPVRKDKFTPGSILVQDQPTLANAAARPAFAFTHWEQLPAKERTLDRYEALHRQLRKVVKGDEYEMHSYAREWVIERKDVALVSAFGCRADVEAALFNNVVTRPVGEKWQSASAPLNWRRAHVVDLDSMTVYVVDGPGFAMENGNYERNLRQRTAQ